MAGEQGQMAAAGGSAGPDTVDRLRALVRDSLTEALDGAKRVALLEFPDHGNVGDSAIWLGERRLLAELGVEVVYASSQRTYRKEALQRRLSPSDVILMHGGGNFGDVWPSLQKFKLQVLEDFPTHDIVFLPQSMHFLEPESRRSYASAIAQHGRVTLMARDSRSLSEAEHLGAERSLLSPDSAFGLDIKPFGRPDVEVLWLLRQDREARGERPHGMVGVIYDWGPDPCRPNPLAPRVWRSVSFRARAAEQRAITRLSQSHAGSRASIRELDRWAGKRLNAGIRLLSRGEYVVTDRLHGHILCLLLGIPNLPLNNSYGKVATFVETWGTYAPLSDLDLGWSEAAERISRNRL